LRTIDDRPFVTDGGNYIADCVMAEIKDATALETCLANIIGVVESGLFIGVATMLVIGRKSGVEVLQK
jgi:ribose 5-phosphate isomerase A